MATLLGTLGIVGAVALYFSSTLSSRETELKRLNAKLLHLEQSVLNSMSNSATTTNDELISLMKKVQILEAVLNNYLATVNANDVTTLKSDVSALTAQISQLQQSQKDICKKASFKTYKQLWLTW